jgi:ribosomal protein S18 acetylase RimI-like enzyme
MFRRATPDDLPAIASLYRDARAWLAAKGTDQWQNPVPERRIAQNIDQGTCWVLIDDGDVIGTVTVDDFADPDFWTEDDNPDDALYVHRSIVRRDHAGQGLGTELLDHASRLAADAGKRWLRLDAWRTNPELISYYKDQGFTHVRTVWPEDRRSGALFQRPVSV